MDSREHERGQMTVLHVYRAGVPSDIPAKPISSPILLPSTSFSRSVFLLNTDEAGEDGTSVRSNEVMFEAPDRDIAHEVRLQERQVMVSLLMHSLSYFAR